MKILKLTISLLLVCLLLCSCAEVPENHKNPYAKLPQEDTQVDNPIFTNSSTDDNAAIAETNLVERGSLDNIRSQLSSDLQRSCKNIAVTRARVSEAQAMPAYDINIGINPDFDFYRLIERLYSDRYDCSDERYYTHKRAGQLRDENDKYPPHVEPIYYEEDDIVIGMNMHVLDIDSFEPNADEGYFAGKDITLSSFMYSIGSVWGSQSGGGGGEGTFQDWYIYSNYDIYKQYDLYFEAPPEDEAYTMVDGEEWNACESIRFVEDFWAEYIAPSDPDNYTYSVKTLYIMALDDDKYGYLFSLQRQDEYGNYLDADRSDFFYSAGQDPDSVVGRGEPFVYPNGDFAYCAQKEVFNTYNKCFSFSCENAQDQGEDLLTLGGAMNILSQTLSSNASLTLTAELNYVVVCRGYPYIQEWEYPVFYDQYCLSTCDFELRPMWCFRKIGQTYLLDNDFAVSRYFVDAITGEVSVITGGYYKKPT